MKRFGGVLVGLLFLGIPGVFLGVGTWFIIQQQHKLETWLPVPARVLSATIEVNRSSDSTSYKPVVRYSYEVDGRSLQNDQVTILNMSSGRGWAQKILDRFPVGSECTAWHDPEDPAESYLLHEISFFPYIFVLFPQIFLALGGAVVYAGLTGAGKVTPPERAHAEWFRLRDSSSPVRSAKAARWGATWWLGVGGLACGHYFMHGEPPYGALALIATGIYMALGLIPVQMWRTQKKKTGLLHPPKLFINQERLPLGGEITFHVEQEAKRSLALTRFKVGLVSERQVTTGSGKNRSTTTQTLYNEWRTPEQNKSLRPREYVDANGTFNVPAGGRDDAQWKLKVIAEVTDGPKYETEFMVATS